MNTNYERPMPAPYTAKINEPFSTGYYQQAPSPNPNIQQGQPTLIGNPMIVGAGDHSMACNCPYCYQPIVTKIEKDTGLAVWLASGLFCLFGCICGCCLIPFCIEDLQDTIHYCPNCNRVIAQNKRL